MIFRNFSIGLIITLNASATDTHLPSLVEPHRLRISQSPTADTPAIVSFETTPGIQYTLEKSDDLSSWQTVGQIYGLGHSISYPLANSISYTAADGSVHQEQPEMVAAIISRLSGSNNQVLIRWFPTTGSGSFTHSHDGQHSDDEYHTHETHSTALVEFELSANWDSVIPLSTHQIGGTTFSISYGGTTELTGADHPIIQNDGLIPDGISKLIANLTTIDENVQNNQLTAALFNNFSDATVSQSKFVRLRIDWSLDSDGDGIPDWAEFKIASETPSSSNGFGFAFDPDADKDGIVDGHQADTDGDGLVDMLDPAKEDPTIDWLQQPEMRYAVFPIGDSNLEKPLQINDLGQVLFHQHVWQNGELKELTAETDEIQWCTAMGMNNKGQIIGFGSTITDVQWQEGNLSGGLAILPTVACIWETADSDPILIWDDDDRVAGGELLATLFYTADSYPADSLIDDSGRFIAQKLIDDKPHGVWQKQSNAYSFQEIEDDLFYVLEPNLSWGPFRVFAGDAEIKAFNRPLLKLTRRPSDGLVALFEDSNSLHQVHGTWKKSSQFKAGVDMSANGLFVNGTSTIKRVSKTGRRSNGSRLLVKQDYDLAELAPDFEIQDAQCVDLSPKGWLLITSPENTAKTYVALPLVLNKPSPGWGIDVTSIRSVEPGEASENRAWIMVNQAGNQQVEIRAPLSLQAQLTIESDLASMTPAILRTSYNTVSFQGTSDQYADGMLQLRLGNITSLSNPIGLKSMPRKTVKIALWPISNQYPGSEPTAEEWADMIDEVKPYWDRIFGQQCGLNFQIDRKPISKISWDIMDVDDMLNFLKPDDRDSLREKLENKGIKAGNALLEIGSRTNPTIEQTTIIQEYLSDEFSINLFCVEHAFALRRFFSTNSGTYTVGAGGVASPNIRDPWVFIPIAHIDSFGSFAQQIIDAKGTIAHEFGHIVLREGGHPHQGGEPAPLPGTDRAQRLLGYPPEGEDHGENNTLLVKAEWDHIQQWVESEIAKNRIE